MTMEFARRNFARICYNLCYRPPILDPYSLGAREQKGNSLVMSD
jgi:hypothetical protein